VHCHGPSYQGTFKLSHVYENTGAQRRSTQQNLAAVVAQLNLEKPLTSPLLVKAVTAHDESVQASPLKGRQAPPYLTLEEWVQTTVTNNPQLQGRERSAGALAPKLEPKTVVEAKPVVETKPSAPPPAERGQFAIAQESPTTDGTAAPEARRPERPVRPEGSTAAPVDEFDPAIFNRQMHGAKKN
jgi:hypothetical protein